MKDRRIYGRDYGDYVIGILGDDDVARPLSSTVDVRNEMFDHRYGRHVSKSSLR
jgi:hypothetical protein